MLRDVIESDLPILFSHQLDPEATRMAAFPAREQWSDFLAHWKTRILGDSACCKQTVLWDGEVAGHVSSWPSEDRRLVGYWLGRADWSRGIATAALGEFLQHDLARPLHAIVAAHNVASIRVLEKCGFVCVDKTTAPDGVEEYLYRFGR